MIINQTYNCTIGLIQLQKHMPAILTAMEGPWEQKDSE